MTFSSEIYRRLGVGMSILDEPDERISVQEIEVSVPTRKRRLSDDLFEEDWKDLLWKETDESQRIN